ncbi:MAG: glycosyltransferase family 9 protein [Bacillota bacterium]
MATIQERIQKIVLLCLSPLGDTIFATPAIRALRESFPQARIVVLASRIAAEVLKRNPFQLELLAAGEKWDLVKILTAIRKEGFDIAVSLSQLGGFFTRFCAAPVWSDFTLVANEPYRSVVDLCHEVLKLIGINKPYRKTEFWLNPLDQRNVDLFLRGSDYDPEMPMVAVHAGGHYFVRKRWPIAKFIEALGYLVDNGLQVILVGGREDVEDSLMLRSEVPGIISAVGMLKLAETAALLSRCRLFIGNDSGPLHLAAALNTPTIGLFGPTNPQQFYPYRPIAHRHIYKNLSCSPCYRFGGGIWQYLPRCSKAYCMESISVADLLTQVNQLLASGKPRPDEVAYAERV